MQRVSQFWILKNINAQKWKKKLKNLGWGVISPQNGAKSFLAFFSLSHDKSKVKRIAKYNVEHKLVAKLINAAMRAIKVQKLCLFVSKFVL